MRLNEFILSNMEPLAAAWERFASTRGSAGARMDKLALRDHVESILAAIAVDIIQPQSRTQQHEKSLGAGESDPAVVHTAAAVHAVLRAQAGFDINQLVAEYRALRASVLRLWFDSLGPEPPDAFQVVRFNEAIDQAIAESVASFHANVEQARNLLLGMLGHDMRTPLQTVQLTAQHLAAIQADDRVGAAAARLISAGRRMQSLLDDLVDFNRTRLGLGIRVYPAAANLGADLRQEIEQVAIAHPERRIHLSVRGECEGCWDAMRLRQLLSNLVVNALRHGDADGEVRVQLEDDGGAVHIEVSNSGPTLDADLLAHMFDPLRRGSPTQPRDGHSLGLGLYIAREIVRAHGGAISVSSQDGETCFSVELPKDRRAEPRAH